MVGGGILLGRYYTPRSALQLLGFKVMVWFGVAQTLGGVLYVAVFIAGNIGIDATL